MCVVCVCVCVYLWVVILRYIVSPTLSLVKSFKYLLQDKNYYSIYALCIHYNSKYLAFCVDCGVLLPFLVFFFFICYSLLLLLLFLRSSLELKRFRLVFVYSASILLLYELMIVFYFIYSKYCEALVN